jgi:hypothetical protein
VNLVALDPGLRLCGVALFTDGVLTAAALVRNPVKTVRGPAAWFGMGDAVRSWLGPRTVEVFVCEVPQVYRSTPNPADLIELAGVDGACAVSVNAREFHSYKPVQWKHNKTKEKHHPFILDKLAEVELAAFEPMPESLKHNVIDAVGIGLFYLGR